MYSFLENLVEPKPNGPEVAKLLLDILNIQVSMSTLQSEIMEHSEYPSLISISDILNNYGIENITARFDLQNIKNVEPPFITQVTGTYSSMNFFTVVKDISKDSVIFFDPEGHRWTSVNLCNFFKRCSGLILMTEVKEGAGDKDYYNIRKKERQNNLVRYISVLSIPTILLISVFISFLKSGVAALLPSVYSLFTLAGCVVSLMLIWFEIDQFSPALKKICSIGKKINCGAILNSKASKILGISWSTIGFTYFIGNLSVLLFEGILNPLSLHLSAWINVLAIPYIFYSIIYQWKIARQWCILCLLVQGLLASQFVIAYIGCWHKASDINMSVDLSIMLKIVLAYLIPFIIIRLILPVYQTATEAKRIKIEFQRLKHNPLVFENILKAQKQITEIPDSIGITLGHPNAKYKISKICSPYCGPCANAHITMAQLLENNSNVQMQIIFTSNFEKGDIRMRIIRHLLALDASSKGEQTEMALDDWYLTTNKDYEVFANKYPFNGILKEQDNKIDVMQEWCKKNNIQFTPTFFINGYQLPEIYMVNDLKYFLSI